MIAHLRHHPSPILRLILVVIMLLYAAASRCQGEKGCTWQIEPDGSKSRLVELEPSVVHALAFGAGGDLYVSGLAVCLTGVLRVGPDGRAQNCALGYLVAAGLAFDLARNLYVSHDRDNSIPRIPGSRQGTLEGHVSAAATAQSIGGALASFSTGYPVIPGEQLAIGNDGCYQMRVAPRSYDVVAMEPGLAPARSEVQVSAAPSRRRICRCDPSLVSTCRSC